MNNAIGNRQCINKCLELVSDIRGGSMAARAEGDRGEGVLVLVCACSSSVRDDKG